MKQNSGIETPGVFLSGSGREVRVHPDYVLPYDKNALMAFSSVVDMAPIRVAKALFPHKSPGYVQATKTLGKIASNLSAAQWAKLANTGGEDIYMHIVRGLFDALPTYAIAMVPQGAYARKLKPIKTGKMRANSSRNPKHRRNVSTLTAAAAGFVGGAIAERRLGLIKKVVSNPKVGFSVAAVRTRFPGVRWHVTAPNGDVYESAGGFYDDHNAPGESAEAAAIKAGWQAVKKGTYTKGSRVSSKRNPEPWAPRQTRMPPSRLTATSAPGFYVVSAKGSYLSGPWTTAAKAAVAPGASRTNAQIVLVVGTERNPSASYLVVLQDRPPGSTWRYRHDKGPYDSIEKAKAVATVEADEFVDVQKDGWKYQAAIYAMTDGSPGDKPVAIVRPSKAREAVKAKARKAAEYTKYGQWEKLAKLERWPGRTKRGKKNPPDTPSWLQDYIAGEQAVKALAAACRAVTLATYDGPAEFEAAIVRAEKALKNARAVVKHLTDGKAKLTKQINAHAKMLRTSRITLGYEQAR